MRWFFERFAWSNLPLTTKIRTLIIGQGILIAITIGVTLTAFLLVRARINEVIENTVEARNLAQSMQLEVENLQRTDERLNESVVNVRQPDFPDQVADINDDHDEAVTTLTTIANELDQASGALLTDSDSLTEFQLSLNAIRNSIADNEFDFNQQLTQIGQLSDT
ncbi:MAG: hypothetical protein GYB68_05645, partial [Chloroflexi bacterium]|nr:hypothetical protein [Chloroflexota bacterium]